MTVVIETPYGKRIILNTEFWERRDPKAYMTDDLQIGDIIFCKNTPFDGTPLPVGYGYLVTKVHKEGRVDLKEVFTGAEYPNFKFDQGGVYYIPWYIGRAIKKNVSVEDLL